MKFKQGAEDYVSKKGWKTKTSGKEIIVDICPFCKKDKFHFYVSAETGAFHCKVCGKSGSLWKLMHHMGDANYASIRPGTSATATGPNVDTVAIRKALHASESAKEFLKNRGISGNTAKHFKLGFDQRRNAIAIPYFNNGKLENVKYRYISKKGFEKEAGCASTLFNVESIDPAQPIIITEGEFDAMAAWQLGFINVVSLPDGAPSIKTVMDLPECKSILVATDMDAPGEQAAANISELIGHYRCKRVKLPHKDFNDCLLAGMTGPEIQACIDSAKSLEAGSLLTGNDLARAFDDEGKQGKKPAAFTGWRLFDGLLKGIRGGEVTILSADTGVGKSTWAANLFYKMVSQDAPSLCITGEERALRWYRKLCSIHTGKCSDSYKNDRLIAEDANIAQNPFTDDDKQECSDYFSRKPVFAWEFTDDMPLYKVDALVKWLALTENLKFVVLDHLHYFINSENPDHERHAIEKFTKGLSRLAIETDVHILLVCHPSKSIGSGGRVHMNALKGSSSIKQDAANVITLYRDRESGSTDTEVWIQKKRAHEAREGKCVFTFDELSLRYDGTYRIELNTGWATA